MLATDNGEDCINTSLRVWIELDVPEICNQGQSNLDAWSTYIPPAFYIFPTIRIRPVDRTKTASRLISDVKRMTYRDCVRFP